MLNTRNENNDNRMDKIVSLCKRRGFVYPGSEIYGGLANSWDFGPPGVELKNNIKQLWWKFFVQSRENIVGLESTIIMNNKVWEAAAAALVLARLHWFHGQYRISEAAAAWGDLCHW